MQYKFIDNKEQHLHTLDMVPLLGTSTVLDIVAKQLTYWASGMAVMELGVTDPKVLTKIKDGKATKEEYDGMMISISEKLDIIKGMDNEQYFKLLDKAYRAHASNLKKTAKKGTDLHAELERFVNWKMSNKPLRGETFDAQIQPFIDWADINVAEFLFSEGHTYSEKYWLGGIIDCGVILNSGDIAIIDFKSAKAAYNTSFWQVGGYDIQATESGIYDADGNKLMDMPGPVTQHIVVPFGSDPVLPVVKANVEENKKAFLLAMELYKIENSFLK